MIHKHYVILNPTQTLLISHYFYFLNTSCINYNFFSFFLLCVHPTFSSTYQGSPLNRGKPRRKMEKPKQMVQQDLVVSRNIFSSQHKKSIASLQDGSSSQKVNNLSFVISGIN